MKQLTTRQNKQLIEDLQRIVDRKTEKLVAVQNQMEANLLKAQIKGRQRVIDKLKNE
jgi:hypothetical protein